MQTKKVKAIDLLNYTLPLIVRGRSGVYEIVKAEADSSRIKLYRLTPNGHHSLVISRPRDEYLEVFTNTHADHLLDTIGALYTRNKSLTKGHATLTRRVQELEAALEAEKQRGVAVCGEKSVSYYDNKGAERLRLGVIDLEKEEKLFTNSKAQQDLQQFVTEEVKRQLVAATKLGGILNGR